MLASNRPKVQLSTYLNDIGSRPLSTSDPIRKRLSMQDPGWVWGWVRDRVMMMWWSDCQINREVCQVNRWIRWNIALGIDRVPTYPTCDHRPYFVPWSVEPPSGSMVCIAGWRVEGLVVVVNWAHDLLVVIHLCLPLFVKCDWQSSRITRECLLWWASLVKYQYTVSFCIWSTVSPINYLNMMDDSSDNLQ